MQITIWYRPASARTTVFIHAWDQNGLICDLAGTPSADGNTFSFSVTGTTQDQREVSFKYRFGPGDWEADTWIRTVPTLSATELWTEDFSARCATEAPGPPSALASVNVHAITRQRFNGGSVWAWTNNSAGQLFNQTSRDDTTMTSTFAVALPEAWRAGFYFKLVGPGKDFEPDVANRFWQPSDGAGIWVKSGQVDVQSQPIEPVPVEVDFVVPTALGIPQLRIQDLVGDFDDTHDASSSAALDAVFTTVRYSVSVYTGALYNVWWTTEPQSFSRRFRIPMGGDAAPSIAVNGYDHWLPAPPVPSDAVSLVIHPNPGTAFGESVPIEVGIGEAAPHQTISATRGADGTWTARIDTFSGVPFHALPVGEARPDGPLDFRRVFKTGAGTSVFHTIDGVGGVSAGLPGGFADAAAGLRQSLMEAAFGRAVVAAGVFDPWEMPHGVTRLADTTYFVVRAPHAVNCSVLVMLAPNAAGTPRNVTAYPMSLTNDLRYWWAAVPAAEAPSGALYRFAYSDGQELLAPEAKPGEVLDPASRQAFDQGSLLVQAGSGAEQSWSVVADVGALEATMAGSEWRTAGWNWLLIYEMHAQRFTQRNPGCATDFDQVIRELQGGYLARLPVTALELLPLHEFPADQAGWGYNPSLFFAIDSGYGGPEAFARMVRAAHDAGRAVLSDVVYNHMSGSPLQIVGKDIYVSGETQWGDMIYFAHPAAREFFRQATVYLWSAFRLDGMRFDSTETIVNGGNANASSAPFVLKRGPDGKLMIGAGGGWEFLGILQTALRRAAEAIGMGWPYLTGENDPENPPMTDPASGVLEGQWHFSEMYALNNAAANVDDHSVDVRGGLDSSGRPFQRSVIYGESHDSASGQNWTKRIAATEKWGNGRQMAKAVGTVALLAEGIPMIFMGEEAGEDQAFVFGAAPADPGFALRLNDYESKGSEFLQILTWFRDLMGLRNNARNGLQGNGDQTTGQGNKTVAFSRAQGAFFVVVTFGTGDQQQNLGWLGLPGGAAYKEIFNSSWPQYAVHGEPLISNGGYAARLGAGDLVRLPSIGAVVLQRV